MLYFVFHVCDKIYYWLAFSAGLLCKIFKIDIYIFGYFCSQSIQMYVFGIFLQVSGECQTLMREERSCTGWVFLVKCKKIIPNSEMLGLHCLLWPWYLFTFVFYFYWCWSHVFPIEPDSEHIQLSCAHKSYKSSKT